MINRLALALKIIGDNKVLFYLPEKKEEIEVLVEEYIFADIKENIDNEEGYYLLLDSDTSGVIDQGEFI